MASINKIPVTIQKKKRALTYKDTYSFFFEPKAPFRCVHHFIVSSMGVAGSRMHQSLKEEKQNMLLIGKNRAPIRTMK